MNVRRIHPDDGPLLKEARLRALLTDPDAFGASLKADAAHDDDHWMERARAAASGHEQFIAFAEDEGRVVGRVGSRPRLSRACQGGVAVGPGGRTRN